MTNANDWIENTGTVPDGVTAYTVIEVEYRDGEAQVWKALRYNNKECCWTLIGNRDDVIRWRFA